MALRRSRQVHRYTSRHDAVFSCLPVSLSTGWLYFFDFRFLAGAGLIHLFDMLVGQLLQINFAALEIIFRDHLFLLEFAQVVMGGAADVADGDARFFQAVVDHFNELFAALFGERRMLRRMILPSLLGVRPSSEA